MDFVYHSADTDDDLGLDFDLGVNHFCADDLEDLMMKDIGLGVDHSASDHEDIAKIT